MLPKDGPFILLSGWKKKYEMGFEDLFQFMKKRPLLMMLCHILKNLFHLIIAMGAGDVEKNPIILHRSFQFGNVSLSALEFT